MLLRPSYVIGGQNMIIARSDADIRSTWRSSSPVALKTRC
ncbi:MAG: hypothetical protein V8T45_01555 [Oscillospiraceae bacterium]